MRMFLSMLIAALMLNQSWGQGVDAGRAEHLLRDADERFEAAMADRAAGNPSAADAFRAAARSYEAIASMGIRNPDLYVDAGNAFLLGGDAGRAVLSFRRADLLRPHDPAVRAGLADARGQVQIEVPRSGRARLIDGLLMWREHVPRRVVLGGFFGLYVIAWVIGIARTVTRGRVPGWVGVTAGLSAGVLAGALFLDHHEHQSTIGGVVISEGITARNGPSAAVYQPTFTTPLRPGVELVVLEHRDGWYHCRLADSRQTWLPDHAVELVQDWAPTATP